MKNGKITPTRSSGEFNQPHGLVRGDNQKAMESTQNISLSEIKSKQPEEAIMLLDAYIAAHPEDEEALTIRGMRHWAMGHRSLAINDYLAAIKINPDSKAKMALQAANSILDYYNKDLLNP